MVVVSLLWEVTLALPYGWWGYRTTAISDLTIGAWSQLPIEAVWVWLAVSFTTVISSSADLAGRFRASGTALNPRFKGLWPCAGIFAQAVCKPIPSGQPAL